MGVQAEARPRGGAGEPELEALANQPKVFTKLRGPSLIAELTPTASKTVDRIFAGLIAKNLERAVETARIARGGPASAVPKKSVGKSAKKPAARKKSTGRC